MPYAEWHRPGLRQEWDEMMANKPQDQGRKFHTSPTIKLSLKVGR